MKLEGRLTILGSDEGVTIEVEDHDSSTTFLTIELTPEQFCRAALGRLASMRCELDVNGLERVGRCMETDTLIFPLPSHAKDTYGEERKNIARDYVYDGCPVGWTPDTHFNSQDSFFRKDGHLFARTAIRRWV